MENTLLIAVTNSQRRSIQGIVKEVINHGEIDN